MIDDFVASLRIWLCLKCELANVLVFQVHSWTCGGCNHCKDYLHLVKKCSWTRFQCSMGLRTVVRGMETDDQFLGDGLIYLEKKRKESRRLCIFCR